MEVEIYIMTYNIEKVRKEDNLRILGGYFVKNNMNKTKLIINNKISTLKEYLQINNNNKNDLKIKIIIDKSMYNMNYFFKDCYSLLKLEITGDYWKEIIKDDIMTIVIMKVIIKVIMGVIIKVITEITMELIMGIMDIIIFLDQKKVAIVLIVTIFLKKIFSLLQKFLCI